MYRKTRALIQLSNLKENIHYLRNSLKPTTKYLAVVKANAYGHGIVQVSDYIERNHLADYFGVAIPEEGLRLRKAGIASPILILGHSDPEDYEDIIENNLIPAMFNYSEISALNLKAKDMNRICNIHLKIDTGMNRIGFKDLEHFKEIAPNFIKLKNINIDGIFTHFAVSDESNSSFTQEQVGEFKKYVDVIHSVGIHPIVHCANSAAIINFKDYQFDMVRGGIAMYGYHPAAAKNPNLKPVMTWKSEIANIKTIHTGETVSYGRKYQATKDVTIATIPVGYGDGYKRCLSNKACIIVSDKKVPIVGTICMDQLMVDVTGIKDLSVGDDAILIGTSGSETINADDLALLAETISYEILLSVSERVPRDYIE